jgi:hypothetical protein
MKRCDGLKKGHNVSHSRCFEEYIKKKDWREERFSAVQIRRSKVEVDSKKES